MKELSKSCQFVTYKLYNPKLQPKILKRKLQKDWLVALLSLLLTFQWPQRFYFFTVNLIPYHSWKRIVHSNIELFLREVKKVHLALVRGDVNDTVEGFKPSVFVYFIYFSIL